MPADVEAPAALLAAEAACAYEVAAPAADDAPSRDEIACADERLAGEAPLEVAVDAAAGLAGPARLGSVDAGWASATCV